LVASDAFSIEKSVSNLTVRRCVLSECADVVVGKATVLDSTHADRIVAAVRALLAGRSRLTTEQKRQILGSIVRRVDVNAQKATTRHVRG
jgi:hypothetical protein